MTRQTRLRNVTPLEMEPMRIASSTNSARRQQTSPLGDRLGQLLMVIKLHIQHYPLIVSCIAALCVGILFSFFVLSFRRPVTRNRLYRDYSAIDMNYTFKASQVNHWCLWGGDDQCKCDDFTEPLSRDGKKDWMKTHKINVNQIDTSKDYDVVFYGDEVVEGWNGLNLGKPMLPVVKGTQVHTFFTETFTKGGGGEFEGLALGIMGDVSPNLLWRLRHGEMPLSLNSKVFWLAIGMNDLVRGGCSEEATVLGILRVADEIYFGNPNSVIVIQGILPWSKYSDGSLEHHKHGFHPLQYGAAKEYGVKDAKQYFTLWPSIQHINAELEKFCSLHNHLIYFDVSALFLGTVGNQIYRKKEQHIITTLLSEGKTLTFNGYTVLGVAIQQELERIIYDGNEKNDLEGQT